MVKLTSLSLTFTANHLSQRKAVAGAELRCPVCWTHYIRVTRDGQNVEKEWPPIADCCGMACCSNCMYLQSIMQLNFCVFCEHGVANLSEWDLGPLFLSR